MDVMTSFAKYVLDNVGDDKENRVRESDRRENLGEFPRLHPNTCFIKQKARPEEERIMRKIIITVAAVLLSFGGNSYAFDTDDIAIHGFGSTGYLKSDHNNYLIQSENGSFEFNEAGLSVTTELTDNARAGIQLFSRDLGNVGNNAVNVDWAFLDYHRKEIVGIRLGKMKLPENLYNDTRDYDLLRSSILLPQSVYNEYYRETEAGYQGAGLYGNLPAGPIGRLGYDAFVGTTSDETELFDIERNGLYRERIGAPS
jgi:hypothetical protein